MKMNSYVVFLREMQNKIQEILDERIDMRYNGDGHSFGVWISVRCGKCGREYSTPYFIHENGRCTDCKKLIYKLREKTRKQKISDNSDKSFNLDHTYLLPYNLVEVKNVRRNNV
jgi:hypothetical protein